MVWQIPFLGVEIPLAKYIVSLCVPPFAGLAGAAVFRMMTRWSRTSGMEPSDIGVIAPLVEKEKTVDTFEKEVERNEWT